MRTWLWYESVVEGDHVREKLSAVVGERWVQRALAHAVMVAERKDDGSIDLLYFYGRLEPLVDDDDFEPDDNRQASGPDGP